MPEVDVTTETDVGCDGDAIADDESIANANGGIETHRGAEMHADATQPDHVRLDAHDGMHAALAGAPPTTQHRADREGVATEIATRRIAHAGGDAERIEFVAEGVDMIVATDHNVVADYAPYIKGLGLGGSLSSTPGNEVSTGWGHFGAFPLPVIPKTALPKLSGMKPQQVVDAFHAMGTDTIINVHHPRLERLTGYFWIGKFDAKRATAKRKDFSFDFDAIELLNGYEDTKLKLLDRNMTDWFALLDRGVVTTATGNSDSHHMTYNLNSYPRNYVQVPDDAAGTVTGADMAKGIKAHRAFFTTGPIVDFGAGKAGIGDLAPAPDGKAKLEIAVRAAPWVSVSRVKLYVAGKLEHVWDVEASDKVERLKTTYELVLPHDTHAVVRVECSATATSAPIPMAGHAMCDYSPPET